MRVHQSPPFHLTILKLSLAVLPCFVAAQAIAQTSDQPEPPIFIESDEASAQAGQYTEAKGNVVINRDTLEVHSDWAKYNLISDTVHAGNKVVMTKDGDTLTGTRLDMSVDTREGELEQATYLMGQGLARGEAVKVLFEGKDKYRIQSGSMTTCTPEQNSWALHAREMDLDYTQNYGQAWHGWLEFQSVPVFYYPWVDFPLDGGRKTGFLMPNVAYSSTTGLELTVPFYWNIAPNFDATITPSYFGERGLMLGGEFRYLQPSFGGVIRAEGIQDKESETNRYSILFQHSQQLADRLRLDINYQRVSDDHYFVDFGDRLSVASQVNLPQEAILSYSGSNWSTYLRAQQYQTLQNTSSPITPPYSRLPQWYFSYNPDLGGGTQTSITGEFTRFRSDTQNQGDRSWIYPTVSLPWANSYSFITPKIGVNATYYSNESASGQDLGTQSRVLPIASVNSGLFFEREGTLLGSNVVQTLEPQLYYLYIPFKDQSKLPNYDSGNTDLSWSQLFAENKFSGNDRINDANQVTLALNTRLFDDDSGVERFYAGIGQRFYLSQPKVELNGTAASSNQYNSASDFLLMMGGNLPYDLRFNYTLQQDLSNGTTQRSDLNLNWSPGEYKTINARYAVNRLTHIEQGSLSGQWPLGAGWYGVASYTHSFIDNQSLESLAGLEYNGGCWALRLAAQRYVTTNSEYKTNYFILLELGGLAGIGMNPISTLRQSIPGYADTYTSPKLR
ncbi:LPS-assembly protein LptD [Chitinibacter bivalviorum]|uniref:LPS-assembly protein LptD n=1 Tax=Chitinibacter bivalviorum TaxID=2739434 RepID=A0A7H9BIV4_9NEIS|nr:LPS-assembly protein LptD [Chitinibacter bivalviorum]QLG88587.1 LPS-assembly protein LptD [Chitinibacter bivalviorum]